MGTASTLQSMSTVNRALEASTFGNNVVLHHETILQTTSQHRLFKAKK